MAPSSRAMANPPAAKSLAPPGVDYHLCKLRSGTPHGLAPARDVHWSFRWSITKKERDESPRKRSWTEAPALIQGTARLTIRRENTHE
jgi:hypothetical protein